MLCFHGCHAGRKADFENENNMGLAISGTRTHKGLIWVGGSGIIYDALSQG